MNKDKVAIIGYGYVGKAMHKIFPDAYIYDTRYVKRDEEYGESFLTEVIDAEAKKLGIPMNVAKRETINKECGLAIICVPTPMQETNSEFKPVDTSIVEEVVNWLNTPLILIKSTVPPTTVAYLVRETDKNICFSPEYVGEGKYWISEHKYMSPTDPRTHEFQIIGGDPKVAEQICNYFVRRLGPEKFYYLISSLEAEIIKYMENCWGAVKVIFAQEFYELCKALGASWIKVREGWALDNRVERMHTAVFVDARGFGGKCYPKDLNGIVAFADSIGLDMSLIKTVLRKNAKITDGKSDLQPKP